MFVCFFIIIIIPFLFLRFNGLKSAGAAALQTVVSANWLTLQSASPPPPPHPEWVTRLTALTTFQPCLYTPLLICSIFYLII